MRTSQKMSRPYVLDSPVFIYGVKVSGDMYTVPKVIQELRSVSADVALQTLLNEGLKIEPPLEKDVNAVIEKAKSTGDYPKLSPADIDVLAKALQIGGTLVTDDYSVQNVAARLGVETRAIRQERIKRVLTWRYRCVGCGRIYQTETTCPVCGSEVRLKPIKKGTHNSQE
ncbi:MAG: NOB1 family endonuclease [Halobacteriota archaeon]